MSHGSWWNIALCVIVKPSVVVCEHRSANHILESWQPKTDIFCIYTKKQEQIREKMAWWKNSETEIGAYIKHCSQATVSRKTSQKAQNLKS